MICGGVNLFFVPLELEPGGSPVPQRREFLRREFYLLSILLVDFIEGFGVQQFE